MLKDHYRCSAHDSPRITLTSLADTCASGYGFIGGSLIHEIQVINYVERHRSFCPCLNAMGGGLSFFSATCECEAAMMKDLYLNNCEYWEQRFLNFHNFIKANLTLW